MIIDKIARYKKELVEKEKKTLPLDVILAELEIFRKTRAFKEVLSKDSLSIIAEIKKASPSKGIIKEDFYPEEIAKEYEKCSIDAISVITEDKFFLGDNKYINIVKKESKKPVLRKDFIVDEYQIYQSRYLGADAILIITALHTTETINKFLKIANGLGMSAIVEVHTEREIESAVMAGANIIGINNRDLRTFKTSLNVTKRLIDIIPKDIIVVSESGIYSRNNILELEQLGVNAVLVGESLMRCENISKKIRELRGDTIG